MSAAHSDLGPELRALAQAILDRLDPAVRAAAARATDSVRGPGRCQQVWCPVCALAALVTGEEHPLLSVVAEHSVALMTVIRTMASETPASGGGEQSAPPPAEDGAHNGYHHIPIVVEPVSAEDSGSRGPGSA